jgi:cobyrinic acid a,c-diamide synthase
MEDRSDGDLELWGLSGLGVAEQRKGESRTTTRTRTIGKGCLFDRARYRSSAVTGENRWRNEHEHENQNDGREGRLFDHARYRILVLAGERRRKIEDEYENDGGEGHLFKSSIVLVHEHDFWERKDRMTNTANGLIVGGMQSGAGKTAVTCMILAALYERGLPIQPFKAGPDFIDPGYHGRFADGPSRILDFWLMNDAGIVQETITHGAGRISIVEGVMGLFDGSEVTSDEGSTVAMARLLRWPVILVIPSAKAGRSLAAALRGFMAEAGSGLIAGVILNGVSGRSHAEYLREAIAPLKLPVLGAIPICPELSWPERHLGLQANQERDLPHRKELAQLGETYLDLSGILALVEPAKGGPPAQEPPEKGIRIGLARDQAFHFYYEANLDYLRRQGFQLVEFSPMHESKLPSDLEGLIIGGGFPELFTDELAQNEALRSGVRSVIGDGLPCYAECGGMMWLSEEIVSQSGRRFPMVGAIPGAVEMTPGLQHFGYCECSELERAPSEMIRGHEFHHSRWTAESQLANLWMVRRKRIDATRREGFQKRHLHASYVHLYFSSTQTVFPSLMKKDNRMAAL